MGKRARIAVLALAVLAGVGALVYLRGVREAVERVTVPVVVAAPDLYPEDTLLFAAVHGFDEAHERLSAAWRRVEGTAFHAVIERAWSESALRASPAIRAGVDEFERAMTAAETRLGHRPTTADFFRVYGRYTAFGLVPAADGGRPHMLAVVKLPDDGAMALLEQTLGGGASGAVTRHHPPDIRGYPLFTERPGFVERIFYGIGGGYLFIADALPAMEAALGRLDGLRRPPAAGAPAPTSLGRDAAFRAVAGESWDSVAFALHARRDQQFARWHPNLAILDDGFRGAFVLAPGSPAITFAALRQEQGDDLALRCSLPTAPASPLSWAEALPAGLSRAEFSRTVTREEARRAFGPSVERFRAKAIWAEAAALLRDTDRVEALVANAIPEPQRPGRELLARLPRDVDLVRDAFDALVERAVYGAVTGTASFAKVYGDGAPAEQWGAGVAVDPLSLLLLAGVAEAGADRAGGVIVRDHGQGVLAWRLDVERLLERFGDSTGPLGGAPPHLFRNVAPSVVVTGGRLYVCGGPDLTDEVVAIARGGAVPTLAAGDALFAEATAGGGPGAWRVAYTRPAESLRAMAAGARAWVQEAGELVGDDEDLGSVIAAVLAVLERSVEWARPVRAAVEWDHGDEAAPHRARSLVDRERLAALGAGGIANATPEATAALPGTTVFLATSRVPLRALAADLRAAAEGAIPGGRDRVARALADARADRDLQALVEFVEGFALAVNGECGIAVCTPPEASRLPPVQNLTLQDIVDRLPSVGLFGACDDPERAFDAVVGLLERIRAGVERVPFAQRFRDFQQGRGPQPVGLELRRARPPMAVALEGMFPRWGGTRGGTGPDAVAALRVLIPEGRRGPVRHYTLGVVRRGRMIHVAFGERLLRHLAGEATGDGSLAERLAAELPGGLLPGEVLSLTASRGTGIADCLHAFLEPLAPGLVGVSLAAREERPPDDVLQAHADGWKRLESLVHDLLRDPAWAVTWSRAEADTVVTERHRVPLPE